MWVLVISMLLPLYNTWVVEDHRLHCRKLTLASAGFPGYLPDLNIAKEKSQLCSPPTASLLLPGLRCCWAALPPKVKLQAK